MLFKNVISNPVKIIVEYSMIFSGASLGPREYWIDTKYGINILE